MSDTILAVKSELSEGEAEAAEPGSPEVQIPLQAPQDEHAEAATAAHRGQL